MSTASLNGLLDCSKHIGSELSVGKTEESCIKLEKWTRLGLLTISFLVFSFLIGPQVQSSLPGREAVKLVSQSRQVNIRPELSARTNISSEKAAKAVLVMSLITGAGSK